MDKKKLKPKEIRRTKFAEFHYHYRLPLVLIPVFSVITVALFAYYGSYAPLSWLYALVFCAVIVLAFIAQGSAR